MWHKPQLMNWISSLLFGLSVLTILYALVFVIVHLPIFPIERVKLVRPLAHVTQEQVEFVLKNEMRGNFFTVNLDRMRDAFEKLPWVDQVSLRRRWPNVLEITLAEHEPVARWGDTALLNSEGERFSAAASEELPMFHADNGMEKEMLDGYQRFSILLRNTGVHPAEIWLTDRRAWTMRLSNGLTMQLGREAVDERLSRFVEVYDRTLATLPKLSYVDLRYPNGFAVRMKPSEAPAGMDMKPKKKKPAAAKPSASAAQAAAAQAKYLGTSDTGVATSGVATSGVATPAAVPGVNRPGAASRPAAPGVGRPAAQAPSAAGTSAAAPKTNRPAAPVQPGAASTYKPAVSAPPAASEKNTTSRTGGTE